MNAQLTKSDLFDRIEAYYLKGGQLTDKETEICKRWESAYATLCEVRSKKVAMKKHMAIFKGLSVSQAYIDLGNAERVFNPFRKYTKEFLRMVLIESALKDVKKCEKLAGEEKDIYKWRAIMAIKDAAEKRIIKAAGLDQYDPNLPDFSKLQPHQYNIDMPEVVKDMFKGLIANGAVDITKMFQTISTDITPE